METMNDDEQRCDASYYIALALPLNLDPQFKIKELR